MIFDQDTIIIIHKRAVNANLPDKRRQLLFGIDPKYVGGLLKVATPNEQLLSDLSQMNADGRVIGGAFPLQRWLLNAAYATTMRPADQRYFEELADKVTKKVEVEGPGQDRRPGEVQSTSHRSHRHHIRSSMIVAVAVVVAVIATLHLLLGDDGKVPPLPGVSIGIFTSGALGTLGGALTGALTGFALLWWLLSALIIARPPTAAAKPILQIITTILLSPLVELVGNQVFITVLRPQDANLFADWFKLWFVVALLAVIAYPLAQGILKFGRFIAEPPEAPP